MLTSLTESFATFVSAMYDFDLKAPFKAGKTDAKVLRINLSIHVMQHVKNG